MKAKIKEEIVITAYDDDRFSVKIGNKDTGILTYDEMLGLIANRTLNQYAKRCHDCWLKEITLFKEDEPCQ